MFINNDRMGDGQSLPGSPAGFLGGKKEIKYAMPDLLRNSVPGVADPNFSPVFVTTAADRNRALFR